MLGVSASEPNPTRVPSLPTQSVVFYSQISSTATYSFESKSSHSGQWSVERTLNQPGGYLILWGLCTASLRDRAVSRCFLWWHSFRLFKDLFSSEHTFFLTLSDAREEWTTKLQRLGSTNLLCINLASKMARDAHSHMWVQCLWAQRPTHALSPSQSCWCPLTQT